MLNINPSHRNRRGIARRFVATVISVVAVALALPAIAQATPVTVIPGLPPVEVPNVPGLPTPPTPTPPTTPKPTPKPQPPATTEETPGVPAIPNVKTSTGWIALASDKDHTIYWWKDGKFVKSMPISMGSDAHPTPNGVYYTREKYQHIVMDSSTYGVPVDSPEGYRTDVYWATRMSSDGIFIHAAPWSVAQQGKSNVSHGCINVSTENGQWVYNTIPQGSPIVVRGTVGGRYDGN
ncbi:MULTISPECIES: L,D-transpeptidase [unclassified Gordonia (in: high G+C Gram-positive bacteria)]